MFAGDLNLYIGLAPSRTLSLMAIRHARCVMRRFILRASFAVILSLSISLHTFAKANDESKKIPYLSQQITKYIDKESMGRNYFYKVCVYKQKNGYIGRAAFVDLFGVLYLLLLDPAEGYPIDLVSFKLSRHAVSLGSHWGGDGAGDVLRNFIASNRPVLDSEWQYGVGPFSTSRFVGGHPAKCVAPEN